MESGIYLSAAGALAQESRMDVVANNLANVDTPGFRRGYTTFQKRLNESLEEPFYEPSRDPVLDEVAGGIFVHEVSFDERNGSMDQTGGQFHVGLNGDGWFTIARDGETLFTRAGNFIRNGAGRLVTADGRGDVLDVNGKAIQLPSSGRVLIDEAGTIRVDDLPIAQLAIRGEVDHEKYMPAGDNNYRYVGEGLPEPGTGRVMHGFLEHSTVSSVHEMVALIRTFRAYESNQRMITQQDESFGRAVNDVGRTG